jgi:hydroxyacid-oxoacid transhydrogenase
MVPHGMAVSLTAPEAFRFTFEAVPDRHVRAAELLEPGFDRSGDPAEYLPSVLIRLMRDIGIPNGIAEVGYTADDVTGLVAGTLKQQRILATSPRETTEEDLAGILTRSLSLW